MQKKKENSREDGGEKSTNEPRKLNMEEKRKLEKLLLADIDSAVARYEQRTAEKRKELTDELTANPSKEVKSLFERYSLACKQQGEAEAKLDKLGYDIGYAGSLSMNTYGTLAPALVAEAERANNGRQSLLNLKRTYVIRLFADHADTQSLFAGLSEELDELIR